MDNLKEELHELKFIVSALKDSLFYQEEGGAWEVELIESIEVYSQRIKEIENELKSNNSFTLNDSVFL